MLGSLKKPMLECEQLIERSIITNRKTGGHVGKTKTTSYLKKPTQVGVMAVSFAFFIDAGD